MEPHTTSESLNASAVAGEVRGWQPYHTLWAVLLAGWVFSYADRTITGPVVTWLIDNKIGMIGASSHPHALGGLIGSLFFAGYMLTQYPGGYLGDRLAR
ncbi:hypothetical protein [Streptomyces sp. ME19-01-6]|uniref:hypothetical protein n=1 Tax=Streptomyces sp. ME19-01-6 TaxID=3028686 RepID=UPI0029A89599|nr:hypothetical protein [Streptomyces sp. ME19-01-6]MDX3231886.1 hypothetical protein [Streptomyces sp. ME19-01-6]